MTPKEKAVDLFKKYYCMDNNSKSKIKVIEFETAKRCALIAVDEVRDNAPWITDIQNFWLAVKSEIEKI